MFINQDCSTLLLHDRQRTFAQMTFSYGALVDQSRNSEAQVCDDQIVLKCNC